MLRSMKKTRGFSFSRFTQILSFALLLIVFFGLGLKANGGSLSWPDITANINAAPVTGDTSGAVTYWMGINCAGKESGQHLYQFMLSADALVTIQTCGGADWDTQLILWTESNVLITCNDNACGSQSRIEMPLTAGIYHLIMTGNEAEGPYSLRITTSELSTLGKPVLAPVPAQRGQKVCLYFTQMPASSDMEIYNANGEKLGAVSTTTTNKHCWDTKNAAPGVYFVKIVVKFQDGTSETIWRKAVVIP